MKSVKLLKKLQKRPYVKTISDHYHKNHTPLSVEKPYGAPFTDTSAVEKIELTINHRTPKGLQDKIAYNVMLILRKIVHLVFRDKYAHHAVVLETVAAVPGI